MTNNRDISIYGHEPDHKNIVINGGFTVWQQSESRSSAASGSTTADLWKVHNATASAINYSRQFSQTVEDGYYSLQILNQAADTSIAVGDQCHISYRAEGPDVAHLKSGNSNAKTVTLSFWHLHTETGTYCVSISNDKLSTATRSYVVEYEQAVSNGWEKTEITIDLDTIGTWAKGVRSLGMEIRFCFVSGTTYHTTADAWQSGGKLATSNQENGFATINNLNRIGGVKLEVGDKATQFESETFADTLSKCQRYWTSNFKYGEYPSDSPSHNPATPTVTAINITTYYSYIPFPVKMAATSPTMTYYRDSGGGKAGAWSILVGSWQASSVVNSSNIITDTGTITVNSGHTFTTGFSYTARGFWTAAAEL
jgi:hypothetical protein